MERKEGADTARIAAHNDAKVMQGREESGRSTDRHESVIDNKKKNTDVSAGTLPEDAVML